MRSACRASNIPQGAEGSVGVISIGSITCFCVKSTKSDFFGNRLSGVKHKLRYGGELRVWEGIADSGGDYGVGGNYTCGKELQSGEKLQVGGNP